jgi:archaellum component FlaC
MLEMFSHPFSLVIIIFMHILTGKSSKICNSSQEIQQQNFSSRNEEAEAELDKASALLRKMDSFSVPVRNQTKAFEDLRTKIQNYDDKLDDLRNHTENAVHKANDAQALNDANSNSKVISTVEKVKNITQQANHTLEDAKELLSNASTLLRDAREALENLFQEAQQGQYSRDRLNETLETNQLELYEVQQPVRKAEQHALKLEAKVSIRFFTVCPFVSLFAVITFRPYVCLCYIINPIACIVTVTVVRNLIEV